MVDVGEVEEFKALVVGIGREAESGMRRGHHVEASGKERLHELLDFEEGSGPTVQEEEGYGTLDTRGCMDKMNIEHAEILELDRGLKLRELVDLRFLLPPVIFLQPELNSVLDEGVCDFVVLAPGCVCNVRGQSGQL